MTSSLGQALPGLVPTHPSSKPATANGTSQDPSFGDMVRGADKPSGPENQKATEIGPYDARWVKRAATNLGKGETGHDEPGKTALSKLPVGKSANDDADTDPGKATVDGGPTGQGANPASLQDQLPLLMALHDISHFSTAADNAAADAEPPAPALDSQPSSSRELLSSLKKTRSTSGTDTHDLGPVSRSERAPNTISLPGQVQHSDAVGLGFKEQPRQQDVAAALPNDQAASDIPAPQGKRAAPAMKGIDTAQSALSGQGKQAPSAGRIDIVAEQSFPAPAQNPMSQTASGLVDAIASDSGLRQAFPASSATLQMASSVAVPTHILKIELHPAELGMVTASLRLAGEQLSIELKPETHEAYRRLAADSEAIVKSLRGLGFDVDKVAILQPSIATPAVTRTDASSSLPISPGRDQPSFQPGNSSGNNAGSGGQQPGRNQSNDAQEFGRAAAPTRERAGGDMFI